MRELWRAKNGQFVIIAVLMIAIMITSIAALMHRTATYYKHEPWEEYLTLIRNIQLNSKRLVELSLSNYTHSFNQFILEKNLQEWEINLSRIYVGRGVQLNYILAEGVYEALGTPINYHLGLNISWGRTISYSAANVSFSLNIDSMGLAGYRFRAFTLVNLTILNVTSNEITVTVKNEDGDPLLTLEEENFFVENYTVRNVDSCYDEKYMMVYIIECNQTVSTPVSVSVWDERGIKVTAEYP